MEFDAWFFSILLPVALLELARLEGKMGWEGAGAIVGVAWNRIMVR